MVIVYAVSHGLAYLWLQWRYCLKSSLSVSGLRPAERETLRRTQRKQRSCYSCISVNVASIALRRYLNGSNRGGLSRKGFLTSWSGIAYDFVSPVRRRRRPIYKGLISETSHTKPCCSDGLEDPSRIVHIPYERHTIGFTKEISADRLKFLPPHQAAISWKTTVLEHTFNYHRIPQGSCKSANNLVKGTEAP